MDVHSLYAPLFDALVQSQEVEAKSNVDATTDVVCRQL
jgi:hypothetical protein